MAAYSKRSRHFRQINRIRNQFAQANDLPFANLLPATRLEQALREENVAWSERVWTPLLTLWAFLSHVMAPDSSCRKTVARVLAALVAAGESPCSPKTDPYVKARKRLPESLLARLARDTGRQLCAMAAPEWRFKSRRVVVGDGTTVSMPDTPANQRAYPQSKSQKPGVGFPILRMMVLFCLATGSVLNAAYSPYTGKKTGENAMLRAMLDLFEPGDLFLGDRYFSGYFDVALLLQRGVDVVTRGHQIRKRDFRQGRQLGPMDHVVTWHKPARPDWMDWATYASLPATMQIRELAIEVKQPGFRSRTIFVQTTLLYRSAATKREIADLYRCRWHAELDLRSLKITLAMDVLTCKTPDMVRKEIWAKLLAYNLIRGLIAQAAHDLGAPPRDFSFKAALALMSEMAVRLDAATATTAAELRDWLFIGIGSHQVNDRPDRIEPRRRKRREKSYPLLNESRCAARSRILNAA